jgi:hypothetical protein
MIALARERHFGHAEANNRSSKLSQAKTFKDFHPNSLRIGPGNFRD